ncbi:MAG: hypothetical protein ACI9QD_000074 [Thermoproteota archaeon]|jgi:hypothetical protein
MNKILIGLTLILTAMNAQSIELAHIYLDTKTGDMKLSK